MNIDETLDEPVRRRWLLLSKALESMPLDEALKLAQSAEDFLSGGSDCGPTDTLNDFRHMVAITNALSEGDIVPERNGGPSDASANLFEQRNSVAGTDSLRPLNIEVLRKEGRQILTPRENDILMQIVRGASNKAIAHHLQITEATVKVHIRSIMRKIPAANRTQAAIWAMNNVGAAGQASQ